MFFPITLVNYLPFTLSFICYLGKRKRSLFQENTGVLRDMMAADERYQDRMLDQRERMLEQRERHFNAMMEQERTTRREEGAQTAAFNQALLGVLGQIAQAIAGRNPAPPPLD